MSAISRKVSLPTPGGSLTGDGRGEGLQQQHQSIIIIIIAIIIIVNNNNNNSNKIVKQQ